MNTNSIPELLHSTIASVLETDEKVMGVKYFYIKQNHGGWFHISTVKM